MSITLSPKTASTWDNLVQSLPIYSFLNSSARFDYISKIFPKAEQYIIEDNGKFLGICTYHIDYSRFGSYMYSQHSPILISDITEDQLSQTYQTITEHFIKIAHQNNCFLIRMSPLIPNTPALQKTYKTIKACPAPTQPLDAILTQHIDLTKDEATLLAEMRKNTRYSINVTSQNPDYSCIVYDKPQTEQIELFLKFHKLIEQTKQYSDRSEAQLRKELETYAQHGILYSIVGHEKKQPIACSMFIRYGKYFTYYLSASLPSLKTSKFSISHLIVWEAIRLAKSLNLKSLDLFGGILSEAQLSDPKITHKHPWYGIDFFKRGLGGHTVEYMPIHDIPLNQVKYTIYSAIRGWQLKQKKYK